MEDPQNLPAGSYTVTVTDAAGCSSTQSFEVNQPPSAVGIACSQTVAVSLPGSVLTSRQRTVVAPAFILYAMRGTVRLGGTLPVSNPRFLFVANANGFVDVINLESGDAFVDPIRVPGVRVLAHYWRQ